MPTNSTKKDNIQWKTIPVNTPGYKPPLSKTIIDHLPIEWLVQVEIQDDTLIFLFFDGTEQAFLGTLSAAHRLLRPYGFTQYHRSYLANPRFACLEQDLLLIAVNPPNIKFQSSNVGKEYQAHVKNRFLSKDVFLMKALSKIVNKNISSFI